LRFQKTERLGHFRGAASASATVWPSFKKGGSTMSLIVNASRFKGGWPPPLPKPPSSEPSPEHYNDWEGGNKLSPSILFRIEQNCLDSLPLFLYALPCSTVVVDGLLLCRLSRDRVLTGYLHFLGC